MATDRPIHVAFVRGINVGGHRRLAMADLREVCGSIGWTRVRTHGASGNVVFEASAADPASLAADLEAAIEAAVGDDVTVVVLARERLAAVVEGQPFDGTGAGEIARYVHFLAADPSPDAAASLDAAGSAAEAFVLGDGVVYSRLDRDELGPGAFTDIERVLGVPATRRTWNVVRRVAEIAADGG